MPERRVLQPCVMIFLFFHGMFINLPLIPLHALDLNASPSLIGFIAGSAMITAATGAVPCGILSDRHGRKLFIMIGCTISSVFTFLMAFASNPYALLLFYATTGVGNAALTPSLSAHVGDVLRGEHLGRGFGLYSTFMMLGAASGPAVGGFIAKVAGIPPVFIVSASLTFIVFLMGVVFIPKTTSNPTQPHASNVRMNFRELAGTPTIVSSWMSTFGISFGWGAIQAFFPLYAKANNLDFLVIGAFFTVHALFNGVARLPFGAVLDRRGGGAIFLAASLVGVGIASSLLVLTVNIFVILLIPAITGLCRGVAMMTGQAFIAKSTTSDTRAFAFGFSTTTRQTGLGAGPAILGFVLAAQGFQSAFLAAAIVPLAVAPLVYIYGKREPTPRRDSIRTDWSTPP